MDSFENKVAVVTGGGTGMGRALTLALVSQGVRSQSVTSRKRTCRRRRSWRRLLVVAKSALFYAMSQVKPRSTLFRRMSPITMVQLFIYYSTMQALAAAGLLQGRARSGSVRSRFAGTGFITVAVPAHAASSG